MNVLSRIVGMKKLCVVLGGLGLLSTGAWAQDGGYSGQVDEGGAYGQSPSYTARKAFRLASRAHRRPRDHGTGRTRLIRCIPTRAQA